MKTPPGQVRLVHGDEEAKRMLEACIRQMQPDAKVVVPSS
ncbi:MAG: hypothetical protein ACK4PH_24435 [Aquincola tertiaricarbonis]